MTGEENPFRAPQADLGHQRRPVATPATELQRLKTTHLGLIIAAAAIAVDLAATLSRSGVSVASMAGWNPLDFVGIYQCSTLGKKLAAVALFVGIAATAMSPLYRITGRIAWFAAAMLAVSVLLTNATTHLIDAGVNFDAAFSVSQIGVPLRLAALIAYAAAVRPIVIRHRGRHNSWVNGVILLAALVFVIDIVFIAKRPTAPAIAQGLYLTVLVLEPIALGLMVRGLLLLRSALAARINALST